MLVPKLKFKREDGSDYPDWEEKPIGKYARIFDGVHQTPNYIESGVPFVSVEDIESLEYPTKYISAEATILYIITSIISILICVVFWLIRKNNTDVNQKQGVHKPQ